MDALFSIFSAPDPTQDLGDRFASPLSVFIAADNSSFAPLNDPQLRVDPLFPGDSPGGPGIVDPFFWPGDPGIPQDGFLYGATARLEDSDLSLNSTALLYDSAGAAGAAVDQLSEALGGTDIIVGTRDDGSTVFSDGVPVAVLSASDAVVRVTDGTAPAITDTAAFATLIEDIHDINDSPEPSPPVDGHAWDLDLDAVIGAFEAVLGGAGGLSGAQADGESDLFRQVLQFVGPADIVERTGEPPRDPGFLMGVVNGVTNLGADRAASTITGGTVAIDLFTTSANAAGARAAERAAFLERLEAAQAGADETVRIFDGPPGFPSLFQRLIPVPDEGVDFVVSSAQLPVGPMLATVNLFGFTSDNGVAGGLSVAQNGIGFDAGGLALAAADVAAGISLALADAFWETEANAGFSFTAALSALDSGEVIAAYDGSVESVFRFDNGSGAYGVPFTGRVPFTTVSQFAPGEAIVVNGGGGRLIQPHPRGGASVRIGTLGGFAGWQGGPSSPADFFAANSCVGGAVGFNTATGAFDQSYIRNLGAIGWEAFSPGQAFWVNSTCAEGFTLDLPGPRDLATTLADASSLNGLLASSLVAGGVDGAASTGAFAGRASVLGSASRIYQDTSRSAVAGAAAGASFVSAVRVTSVQGTTADWGERVGLPLLMDAVGESFERSGPGQVAVIPNADGRLYEIAVSDGSVLQRVQIVEIGETPVITAEAIAALVDLALEQISGP